MLLYLWTTLLQRNSREGANTGQCTYEDQCLCSCTASSWEGRTCVHSDGSTENDGACLCGSMPCTSTTGLFCYAPHNLCADYPNPRQLFPLETSSTCTQRGYEWILDQPTCRLAVAHMSSMQTFGNDQTWYPRGCFIYKYSGEMNI